MPFEYVRWFGEKPRWVFPRVANTPIHDRIIYRRYTENRCDTEKTSNVVVVVVVVVATAVVVFAVAAVAVGERERAIANVCMRDYLYFPISALLNSKYGKYENRP